MAKVTERNTKKDILSAYEESLAVIKELKAGKINKRATVEAERNTTTVKTASSTSAEDIVKGLADLRLGTNSVISNLEESILGAKSQLESLNTAIDVQKVELKTVHGVIAEADSLAALVEANSTERQHHELSMEQSRQNWNEESKRHSIDVAERTKIEDKDRKRRMEEFEYEFKLTTARKQDEFNDDMEAQKRTVARLNEAAQDQFADREAALVAGEEKVSNLQSQVAEIPNLIEAAVAEAAANAKKRAEASHGFEVRALKKDLENAGALSGSELAMLKQQVGSLGEENMNLRTQLEAANAKVVEISKSAIEGAQQRIMQQPVQVTGTK